MASSLARHHSKPLIPLRFCTLTYNTRDSLIPCQSQWSLR